MLDFTQQKTFNLQDVFQSMLTHASALKDTIPEENQGSLDKYMDITQRIQECAKPENFSMKAFYSLLDEYDDGLNAKHPKDYPYALPLVKSQGDKAFAQCMRDHLQAVLDHKSKLSFKEYPWHLRGLMKVGLIHTLPGQIKELDSRIKAYEKGLAYLPGYEKFRVNHSLPNLKLGEVSKVNKRPCSPTP